MRLLSNSARLRRLLHPGWVHIWPPKTGPVDSLILNLQGAKISPTGQKVVALSDDEQLEKIELETQGLQAEFRNASALWIISQVQQVSQSLQAAPEIINKLGLFSGKARFCQNQHDSSESGRLARPHEPGEWRLLPLPPGGHQVCAKWVKDRRGRTLSYEDLEHYCKVVTAVKETIRLIGEIDAATPKWPIE